MAENGDLPQEATRRPRRFGLYAPFALLLLFIVGWSVIWFVSARRAGQFADAFIAREAERGRDWICPNRQVSGYPFRIEIACARPQLVVRGQDGLRNEARLGGLNLHARVAAPGHIIAVFSPPFMLRQAAGEAELTWKSARASLRAGLSGISEVSFEITDPALAASDDSRRDIRAQAKAIELHLRKSPGEAPGTDLVGRIVDLALDPLNQLTGTSEPVQVEVQATAPGLVPDPRRRWQDLLEAWRIDGNKARVVLVKANKGQAAIDLSGELGLDAAHRLEGNLQGRARGLDALAGRLTRRNGVDLGGILGRLGGGQGLPLALTFQNGMLRYGPFPIAPLQPLY
jgi:hypothetical protein